MQLNAGDRLEMKKPHPCGGNVFTLLRVGMDFRIRCETCGREVMAPRKKIEKNIRRVMRQPCLNESKYLINAMLS